MSRRFLITSMVTAILLTAGCASGSDDAGLSATPVASAPSPTASTEVEATPPTTPAPAPADIATVSIGATGINTLDSNGTALASAAYSDGPEAMVAFLTDAVGVEPQVVRTGESESDCAGPATTYSWGDSLTLTDPDTTNPPLYVWTVSTRAAQTAEGIRLTSSTGFSVGNDGTAIIQSLPENQYSDEYGTSTGPMVFEVAGTGPEDRPYGGAALVAPEGLVSAIVAPASTSTFYC